MPNYVRNEEGKLCWVSLEKLTPELEQRLEALLKESDGKAELELPGGVTLQVYDWDKHRRNHPAPPAPPARQDKTWDPWSYAYRDTFADWNQRQQQMRERQIAEQIGKGAFEHITRELADRFDQTTWLKKVEKAIGEYDPVTEYRGFSVSGSIIDDALSKPSDRIVDLVVTTNSPSLDASDLKLTIHKARENFEPVADQGAWDRAASHSGIRKDTVGQSDLGAPPTAPKGAPEYKEALYRVGDYASDAGRLRIVDTNYDAMTGARTYTIRYHGSTRPLTVTEHYLKTQNTRAPR